MVATNYYLILGALIFIIGAVGVLTRRSALIIMMCVEMMLNSVNLTLIALSRQWDNLNGQIFVFMIMAVAAAEVAAAAPAAAEVAEEVEWWRAEVVVVETESNTR